MSYQKLFNNYFSTYGSQTGGAAVPAPKPQLTQEKLNEYLKNKGMDNTPAVKSKEAVKPLSAVAIFKKSKDSGWRPTPERSQQFSPLSKTRIQGKSIERKLDEIGKVKGEITSGKKALVEIEDPPVGKLKLPAKPAGQK